MSKETRDRIAFRMQPETRRRIEQWYAADNCQSKNEFIEKAVNFYVDYLEIPEPEMTSEVVPEPAPEPTPEPPAAQPMQSGDMVYVEGFGWIENQGPNRVEFAADMYENGNKIGIMG